MLWVKATVCVSAVLLAVSGTGLTVHHTASSDGWKRTVCGSPANAAPPNTTDIVSVWGAQINPTNVKDSFGYPRPQMVRYSPTSAPLRSNPGPAGGTWDNASSHSLDGLWQFEPCASWGCGSPPFDRELNESILVPFPVESCLSGTVSVRRRK